MTEATRDTEAAVHALFSGLNDRLQAWFNGTVEESDDTFAEIVRDIDPTMTYVFPSGEGQSGVEAFEEMRGAWGANPDLRIVTPREHVVVLFEGLELVVAEIQEHQRGARAIQPADHTRRSTLVLRRDEDAELGLLLLRLHESLAS